MRYVVLIVAILGFLAQGWLGNKWRSDASEQRPKVEEAMKSMDALKKTAGDDPKVKADIAKVEADYAQFNKLSMTAWVLMAGAVLGLVGGILAVTGKSMIGGIVILVGGITPGVLVPMAFMFTSILIIAGVLAFFVRGKPAK